MEDSQPPSICSRSKHGHADGPSFVHFKEAREHQRTREDPTAATNTDGSGVSPFQAGIPIGSPTNRARCVQVCSIPPLNTTAVAPTHQHKLHTQRGLFLRANSLVPNIHGEVGKLPWEGGRQPRGIEDLWQAICGVKTKLVTWIDINETWPPQSSRVLDRTSTIALLFPPPFSYTAVRPSARVWIFGYGKEKNIFSAADIRDHTAPEVNQISLSPAFQTKWISPSSIALAQHFSLEHPRYWVNSTSSGSYGGARTTHWHVLRSVAARDTREIENRQLCSVTYECLVFSLLLSLLEYVCPAWSHSVYKTTNFHGKDKYERKLSRPSKGK